MNKLTCDLYANSEVAFKTKNCSHQPLKYPCHLSNNPSITTKYMSIINSEYNTKNSITVV